MPQFGLGLEFFVALALGALLRLGCALGLDLRDAGWAGGVLVFPVNGWRGGAHLSRFWKEAPAA